MINRKNKISKVSVELSGEVLDKTITEKQINGVYEFSLPFKFKYNGSWKIKHECENCGDYCDFGLYFNSSISHYSSLTFNQTQFLCSKYFDLSFLKKISELFDTTNLKSIDSGSYIITNDNFDADYPVTSSIQPIFYRCNKCLTEFLCLMRNGYPYSADKECIEGLIGTIFIDEIIQIESIVNFDELLEQYAIK